MATKYELLAALIDAQADRYGDEMGWHHVVSGVLRDLHDWDAGRIPDDELASAIYDRIAESVTVTSFDSEGHGKLAPGEYNADTGAYNPNPE